MSYSKITLYDPNPIKRWLQRRRFYDAIKVLGNAEPGDRQRVLDFGSGNGELIRQIANTSSIDASVFEPTPSLIRIEESPAFQAGVIQISLH
jgi:SAM-dependent methyltransferase